MKPHRIRLRKPWHREPAGERVRWRRRFHRPTGLGPQQRVWLVVAGFGGEGAAVLNGRPLGPIEPAEPTWRFDVTDRLALQNELVLELAVGESPADSPPAEVALEIAMPD